MTLVCRVFKFGENDWDFDLFNETEHAKTLKVEPSDASKPALKPKKRFTPNEIALKWRQIKVKMLKCAANEK